jgi:uncharacterized LabA/DUF88 family protein
VKKESNYAFIDGQNTHLGIKSLGWRMNWKKFRVYLKDKYQVSLTFIFIGYTPSNKELYKKLKKDGFVLIFKPTIQDTKGNIKGNCDADLVLCTMVEIDNFDKAIIVTSDGDFYSLVKYLYQEDKLKVVLSAHIKTCSGLLKIEAKESIFYLNTIKDKISK